MPYVVPKAFLVPGAATKIAVVARRSSLVGWFCRVLLSFAIVYWWQLRHWVVAW